MEQEKEIIVDRNTDRLKVEGHRGRWHVIDETEVDGKPYFLLEHDTFGDDAASIIVDQHGKLIVEDVYNGFDDETTINEIKEATARKAPKQIEKDEAQEPKKQIKFIDSKYGTLFHVPDGGNIVLTYSNGEKHTRACKYLDDYHVLVGGSTYHICQFAEIMECNKTTYEPEKPLELPGMCFSVMPSSGKLIKITKGEKGYSECKFSSPNPLVNRRDATNLNLERGIYPQQEAAMLGGSMFGWNTPAAKVSSYDMHGIAMNTAVHMRNDKDEIER